MTKFAALRRAKKEERYYPSDFWRKDDPKCPHCSTECKVSDNDWWKLYEEGEHEVSCPSCDEDFTVTTSVSFSFSTDEQEGMDEEEEDDRTPEERSQRAALGL